jgi:hypothetical protein
MFNPKVFLHLILCIQLSLFLWTTIHPYTINVPNRTYLLTRGHSHYSSFIRQAKDGAWSLISTHTTRPTPRVYAHLFFVFLGKIAAIGNIDPPMMYMISRVAAGIILFWCTFRLITIMLPKSLHNLAILFTLAVEPGPLLTALTWNPSSWTASIFSYYPQVVAYRHFGLPHHTMGEAVGLLLLGSLILYFRKPTSKGLAGIAILGTINTIILPPYPMILALGVLIPWGIYSLFAKQWKRLILPFVVAAIAICFVAVYTKHELAKGYPWDFNLDEKRWVTNADVLINYVSSLLIYLPFIAYLWAILVKKWSTWDENLKITIVTMSTWVVIPAILVPISSFSWFPLANFRLMDGYNFFPAGILAALGLSYMIKSIKKPSIAGMVSGFLITAVVAASGLLTYTFTNKTIGEQYGFWSNVYLGNGHYKAFEFLNTVPKWSGIMVMNHFGEIIPDYAPVRAFIGTTPGFVNWGELFTIATRFYSGTMTDQEALDMLKKEDISYVYYSDEEKYYTTTSTFYPNILTPIFELPGVTIYKIAWRN